MRLACRSGLGRADSQQQARPIVIFHNNGSEVDKLGRSVRILPYAALQPSDNVAVESDCIDSHVHRLFKPDHASRTTSARRPSKNCLSCHDGTVAFNSLINSPGSGAGTQPTVSPARIDTTGFAGLGTVLSNDHPVSFVYATHQGTDSGLRAASLVNNRPVVSHGGVTLPLSGTTTADAKLECTTCHDPHLTTHGQFKRVANTASQICFTCHIK